MTMEEFSQGLAGMDPAEVALGAGLIGALLVIIAIGSIAWYFISAIGYCKMFKKAGEAAWKAFIPFYSTYVRFKFAWSIKNFWFFLVTLLLSQFFADSESLLLNLLVIVCGIIFIVLGMKLDIRVAKSFGKSAGWGVLLFFFPFIISLILGFSKAAYIGNTTLAAKDAELQK